MAPHLPEVDKLGDIAARLADGEEPDWAEALRDADPQDVKVIESLRVIGRLARLNRGFGQSPSGESAEPLSRESGREASHPSPGPTLRAGQSLGPYEVIGRIGGGGMGEVYRARQTQLGRDVAIKTLPWRLQISPDARRRFEREAQLSASLAHRNVVAIHDFCEHEGIAFVVEELLDGASWRAIIHAHPGAMPRGAIRMIADAASGVAAAHSVGLIHRDLKPENLFETLGGETKVLDFGLARQIDPVPGSPDGGAQSSGVGLGTPTYTAPECLRGGSADRRSDVFALACSAYELLAGTNPFLRANAGDTIVALLKESPAPLSHQLVGVPPHLVDAIDRGLSKRPDDRPTADEIAQAALGTAPSDSAEVRPPGRAVGPRARPLRIAGVIVVSLILALGTYVELRPVPVPLVVTLFDSSALEKELAYVGTAISERVSERLSKAANLQVLSRFFLAQRPPADPRAAGAEAGAAQVLAGKVAPSATGMTATVELIEVSSGRRKWEGRFEGSLADLPAFEEHIALAAAAALGTSLPAAQPYEASGGSVNPEAQRLYAEARYYWFRKTPNELYKSINLFTQALSMEPEYALAHAGLSRAYVDLTYYVPGVSSSQTLTVARRAAERALALDPNLVRGITALADVEAAAWNRRLADQMYRKAMVMDPYDPDAYLGKTADVLLPEGRFGEARELLGRGLGLDASSLARESLGRISYYERDFDRAIREFSEVLETDPGFVSARYRLGQVLLAKGEPGKALVPLWEADKQTRGLAKGRAVIAYALAAAGRRKEAEALLADLLREREKTYVSATLIAAAYTGLGQTDQAFEWLRRGCDEHAEWMHLVGVEPLLDPLRPDRRFAAILKCVGLGDGSSR